MHARTQVDVAADPTTVWKAVSDVESWPTWTESMTEVTLLTDGPLGSGSRARIKQPGMPALVWEVGEFEPGRGFAWTTRSAGVVTTGGHWLESSPAGTTLTLDIDQHGGLTWLVGALTGARTRRYLQLEAAGMKACSESKA